MKENQSRKMQYLQKDQIKINKAYHETENQLFGNRSQLLRVINSGNSSASSTILNDANFCQIYTIINSF